VPALEDPNTGVVSWESGACMNYLRRVYDKSNLLGPVGDLEQVQQAYIKAAPKFS
jgi:glutathione S-transferase